MRNKKILIIISILVFLTLISPAQAVDKWWNATWHHRIKLDINATDYSRTDWPVERLINFTDILNQLNINGTFDINSTRVFEYNSSGQIKYIVPSQLDVEEGYDAYDNAIGTLIFLMNGTTPINTRRYYYVYFDILENGAKEEKIYSTDLEWSWDGKEFNVNNSLIRLWVDTNRGENTSGIYKIWQGDWLFPEGEVSPGDRTFEYVEYFNGTHNLTFDLRNNASFVNGSVRIKVTQIGDEIIWGQPDNKTNQSSIIKEYYFYSKIPWIKIKQEIINIADSSINRNSSTAGALSFDVGRVWNESEQVTFDGNLTEPGSWYSSKTAWGRSMSVININETISEFFANYLPWNITTAEGRIGIQLNNTSISVNSSIIEIAAVYFNGTSALGAVQKTPTLRDSFMNPVFVNQTEEQWELVTETTTEYPVYNLAEAVFIFANVTDIYNLTEFVNATIIPPVGSNETIILYDDGTNGDATAEDKVFTNYYNLSSSDPLGVWNIITEMYDNSSYYLNQSFGSFNLTDVYNIILNISNPTGFPNRTVFANMLVQNFMGYANISNAIVNCSYDGVTVYNITDKNGTYSINFTAPAELGGYTLSCNATRDGNKGNGTDVFWVEPGKTYMSSEVTPTQYPANNITWNVSESFEITVNITNFGEGWAYNTNITLTLPQNTPLNWTANYTLIECGDIYSNDSCVEGFNITVSERTSPGIYLVNASVVWENPDSTFNSTFSSVNVTVTSNPIMEIPEEEIEGIVGRGKEKTVGNFTVKSIGNDLLFNVTFNVTGLSDFNVTLIPPNITSVSAGVNITVNVNVSVPVGYVPGIYIGTINVTTANDGSENITLNITVSGTNMTIEIQPTQYPAQNITWNVSEFFEFTANTTNIGNGTGYSTNITVELPQNTPLNWTANYTLQECGDVEPLGGSCQKAFNITIAERTPSGNYLVNVTVIWMDPELGSQSTNTSLNVTVTSNPILYILEDTISGNATHGKETYLGNFTLESQGNDPLENISYNISGLLTNFTFNLVQNVSSLAAGDNRTIFVNVSIPLGYNPGNFTGTLNVTTDNDGYKNLTLKVTVPINRTWNISQDYCEHPMYPSSGLLCEITVNNTGNVEVNITISPSVANLTWVSETNFTIPQQDYYVFSVLYDINDSTYHFNYSYYNIDANQTDAVPDYIILTTLLTPYVGAQINITFIPDKIEQTDSLEIYANVTDISGKGLQWVMVNVTTPDNVTNSVNMTYVGVIGPNATMWNATYPSYWGNTTLKGNYDVFIYSLDNASAIGNATDSFTVYTKLFITLYTMSDSYYQGETGSIFYRAKDATSQSLKGVNTTLNIKDPNQILIFNFSYETDPGGYIQPLPQFTITSDASVGDYNLTSFSSYYDQQWSELVNDISNYSFKVYGKEGMTLDLHAPFEVATGEDLQVSATVTDGTKNMDVDSAVASLYDPVDNPILTDSPMTRVETGKYTRNYTTSGSSNQGNWKWVVKVSKDNNNISKDIFERLIGGPLDVRNITVVDNTVSDLEVSVVVENTGEATFDVYVEWNLTRTDTDERLDSGLDTVRIDGGESKLHTVYPSTNYVGEVKITFIAYYSGTEKAGAYEIFDTVVGVTTTTVPGPGPGPERPPAPPAPPTPPPVVGVGKIEIVKYPQEITVERGWVKYPSVVVNNTGELTLRDVVLSITGIPPSWYTIEPSEVDMLPVGDSATFNIKLEVPITAETEEYYGVFKVESSQASDEKMFVMIVFASREELLDYEIKKLKQEIQEFEDEVQAAKEEEKDVSEVERLLNEAKEQVALAENYLLRKMFDDALASVFTARNLLDRAKYALSVAPYMKKVLIPFIPMWLLVLLVVLAVVIIVLLIWLKKMKIDLRRILRPSVSEAKEAAEEVKISPEREALESEREKLTRMLKLLEGERKEGIISSKAYKELKFRNETKLAEIEKKLKELK